MTVQGERMWVLVTDRIDGRYLGILDSEPQLLEPAGEVYLRRGAEVAFDPEHVVDIGQPPDEYVAERLAVPPTRRWT